MEDEAITREWVIYGLGITLLFLTFYMGIVIFMLWEIENAVSKKEPPCAEKVQ